MLEEIEISQNDKRLYRYLTLPNGLHALLISDPETSVLEAENGQEHDAEDEDSAASESEEDADGEVSLLSNEGGLSAARQAL